MGRKVKEWMDEWVEGWMGGWVSGGRDREWIKGSCLLG